MQMKIISWKNRWMDRFRDNARPKNSPFVDFTGTEEEINTRNLLYENFLLLDFRFLGNFIFEVKILFWIFHLLERFFSQVLRLFSDERDFLSGYSERDFLEFLSTFCRWKFFVSSGALHLKFSFFLYYQLFHTNTHTQCENFILEPRTLSWDEKGEFFSDFSLLCRTKLSICSSCLLFWICVFVKPKVNDDKAKNLQISLNKFSPLNYFLETIGDP